MQSETTQMLLQLAMLQQDAIVEIMGAILLLTEANQNPSEADRLLASAAAKVRSATYSVDELSDKIQQFEPTVPHR